jgi:cobalt/nickel transport system ATP-binding protein
LITEQKNTLFKLDSIAFAYSEKEPVLNDLSLEIFEGEKISILGANGCGKTTLLKILSGLIFPQSGEFTAFGDKIEQKNFSDKFSKVYHRKIGFIFQDSDVQLFCSTVYEELAFGPLQFGLSQELVKQRINETAQMLNIEHLLEKTPYKLSSGEKKKVAIASVLILNPDVLILDEPTNSLDPRSQSWLLRLLRTLGDAGKTLIFATHNLNLVPEVSDRAVLFDEDHTIAADMPVTELLKDEELLKRVNLVDDNYHACL